MARRIEGRYFAPANQPSYEKAGAAKRAEKRTTFLRPKGSRWEFAMTISSKGAFVKSSAADNKTQPEVASQFPNLLNAFHKLLAELPSYLAPDLSFEDQSPRMHM